MQKLHTKLTQKYPKYNNWHQTKHHNTIHWGVLVVFALIVFTLLSASYSISLAADTVPPIAPTNLTATAISSSQINLSWIASTDDTGVTGYNIYRCAGSACAPTVQIATSVTNSYSNTGLTASTAYIYAVSAYDAAGNESGKSGSVSGTTQAQAQTWQQTLEQNFDIADTFDHYQDWTGLLASNSQNFITNPNDLPKYINDSPSKVWKRYAYNPDGEVGGEGRLGPWIANHGSSYQVGNKGLKLSARGFGSLEMQTYFGNGTANSGYPEVFMFFRSYFPKNAFPTNTEPNPGSRKVEYNQSVFDSTGYLWLTGWKFVNFGTGFTSVGNHSSGCYYGDGEAWFNLANTYNDIGQHPIFGGTTCFEGGPNINSCSGGGCQGGPGAKSIKFDTLGAIEVRLKAETYIEGVLNQPGEIEIWWYDENGTAVQIFYNNQVTLMQPEDAGHLINRIIVNGNKHRYDPTGPPTTPPDYNRNVGEYTLGNGMAKFWYMDDFIVDNLRVGPTYFSLLNGTPPPPDITLPSIPTGLIATTVSSSQINLSWTASTDNVGVTGYKIYRCAGSTCAPTVQIATSTTNSYSNTGLTASTAYTYAVSAYDAAGNESGKSTAVSAVTMSQSDEPDKPLLQLPDLAYLGAFRLQTGGNYFSYGGTAVSFYRDSEGRKTLFLAGHDWYQRVGQVDVSGEPRQGIWSSLPLAPTLQVPTDITEGTLQSVDNNGVKVGGTLPYNNQLIITGFSYYDADGNQILSHGRKTSLDFTATKDFDGFYRMSGGIGARTKAGYMANIPLEWQELFGGTALTGKCCISIIGNTSLGPAVYVFNQADVGIIDPIPGIPLVYYTINNSYPGSGCGTQNNFANCTTDINGVVFPENSNSVLFFGRHGTGAVCYKCAGAGGYHAPPYVAQVWAYDAKELLAVKRGEKSPWEANVYGLWNITDLIGTDRVSGVGYDPVEQRLYIAGGGGENPIVHVVQINISSVTDAVPPSVPINLTASSVSSSQINLSWTASTDNVGVSGYKIYRCAGSGCAPTTQIATSTTNSYPNAGLTASTAYTYTVSAYDAAGNNSAKSSSVPATTSAGFKPSDLNQDGFVNQLDFDILKQDWNRTDKPTSDLNQDGIVDSRDLGIMMSEWTR